MPLAAAAHCAQFQDTACHHKAVQGRSLRVAHKAIWRGCALCLDHIEHTPISWTGSLFRSAALLRMRFGTCASLFLCLIFNQRPICDRKIAPSDECCIGLYRLLFSLKTIVVTASKQYKLQPKICKSLKLFHSWTESITQEWPDSFVKQTRRCRQQLPPNQKRLCLVPKLWRSAAQELSHLFSSQSLRLHSGTAFESKGQMMSRGWTLLPNQRFYFQNHGIKCVWILFRSWNWAKQSSYAYPFGLETDWSWIFSNSIFLVEAHQAGHRTQKSKNWELVVWDRSSRTSCWWLVSTIVNDDFQRQLKNIKIRSAPSQWRSLHVFLCHDRKIEQSA